MEVSSCESKMKYKCEINLNIQDIDKEYVVEDGSLKLISRASKRDFIATFSDGNQFRGYICFTDAENLKYFNIILTEDKFQVKDLIMKYHILVNGVKKSGTEKGCEFQFDSLGFASYGADINVSGIEGKISTCKGSIEIEFQPTSRVIRKEELKGLIYLESFGSETKDLDFTLICQDKHFQFNKHLLCAVSDVFQKMIETSYRDFLPPEGRQT